MTTLKLKVELPEQLAKAARDAGLPTSQSICRLLKDAVRRAAGARLLAGAQRATRGGSRPMSMRTIQHEVDAGRKARKAGSGQRMAR